MTTSTIPVTPVESHQISDIGHCPETNTLCVFFNQKNGRSKPYHVRDVTPAMFAEFKAADSKGGWYNANIKAHHPKGQPPTKHPFEMIEETPQERAARKRTEQQAA